MPVLMPYEQRSSKKNLNDCAAKQNVFCPQLQYICWLLTLFKLICYAEIHPQPKGWGFLSLVSYKNLG
jgi:hypothetical protein